MRYQNISSMFYSFVTKHGRTDRETDGQNYDPEDRASVAASRKTLGDDSDMCVT